MLGDSKYSNFILKFPPDFFSQTIIDKYTKYIKKLPIPFDNVCDFVNWSIQSMSWPEISMEVIEQNQEYGTKRFKDGARRAGRMKECDITFKTSEGYLNYFIMADLLQEFWKLGEDSKPFLPNISFSLFDDRGFMIVTYTFTHIIYKAISSLELSYASNVPEFKTFNCTFNYNYSDIMVYRD